MLLHTNKDKSWPEKTKEKGEAKCAVCNKTFDISKVREAPLTSHAKGAKRQASTVARESSAITGLRLQTKP